MIIRILRKSCAFLLIVCGLSIPANSQKAAAKLTAKPKQVIFAVIYDGSGVEPITVVDEGKLTAVAAAGAGNQSVAGAFYKSGARYDLIFGGAKSGTVSIKSSNIGKDCGGVSAEVTVESTKAKLKGFVMALATNISNKTAKAGLRRTPTAAEKAEIEALVRAEYAKHKVPAASYKQLHYHNLTAVDVNGDGIPELVGSYWVAPKASERGLLFFIAEKGTSGKYAFNHSEYENYSADKVMSGELKDLEDGVYQTLLLDVFDYDNDGTAEIFTIGKAFEGNNYSVFKRTGGKWTKAFDTYDYRCGY